MAECVVATSILPQSKLAFPKKGINIAAAVPLPHPCDGGEVHRQYLGGAALDA
jgi:hypothetical protein